MFSPAAHSYVVHVRCEEYREELGSSASVAGARLIAERYWESDRARILDTYDHPGQFRFYRRCTDRCSVPGVSHSIVHEPTGGLTEYVVSALDR